MKKFVYFTLILALAFGGLKTHLPQDALAGSNVKELAQFLGGKILICTPTGLKYITLADLAKEGSGGQHKKGDDCKICHAFCSGHAGNISSNNFTIAALSPREKIKTANIEEKTTHHYYISQPPRAPPLFS